MSRYKRLLLYIGDGAASITLLAVCFFLCQWPRSEKTGQLRFRPIANRLVRIERGDCSFCCQLDSDGCFVEDIDIPVRPFSGIWSCMGAKENGAKDIIPNSGTPCYEYRSDTLILGFFDDGSRFIPLIGSKVVDFKTYKPKQRALSNYNLPGEFVEAPAPGSRSPRGS